MNFKKNITFFCFSILTLSAFSQVKNDSTYHKVEIGVELQLYPAGYIAAITSNVFLKENLALRFRLGGNFADRTSFSEYNDEEIATGFGGSVGVQKYFPYRKGNFIAGFSVDAWNMWTDWKDDINTLNPQQGTTYNLVIQPWLNGGYLYQLSKQWNTGLTIGVGREFNVITNGENVGEGWMGILTFSTNYRFKN